MKFNKFLNAYYDIIVEDKQLEQKIHEYTRILRQVYDDEKSKQLATMIADFNDYITESCAVRWVLNRKMELPQDTQKLLKAVEQIKKYHENPLDISSPEEALALKDKFANDELFDPTKEPTFTNKKDLGDGVVVYQVNDSEQGKNAVQKALRVQDQPYYKRLFFFWESDDAYPKRVAFKDNKIIAYSATNKNELFDQEFINAYPFVSGDYLEGIDIPDDYRPPIVWLDLNGKQRLDGVIPGTNVKDDEQFIKKYSRLASDKYDFYTKFNLNDPNEYE